jgi:phosphoribosylaminoimidazolecarboxamide formyltransferase/IMP cyclohydrolase
MNTGATVNRALISVSDKQGIVEFAQGLHELGIEIISTGGTATKLQAANIPVTLVSNITGFPEIMDGRVKTLHPKIHGGILGKRDQHEAEAKQHQIKWIDLVVCNLYPFAKTIQKPNATLDDALENIDIGGPSMLRSAAKNFNWVSVVISPDDYAEVLQQLQTQGKINLEFRKQLAAKAFAHTAQYDAMIANYLNNDFLTLNFKKITDLRYGENPHQQASAYQQIDNTENNVLPAEQHQGKQLSYNNIIDTDSAVNCIKEFQQQPACVVIKHTNPCGVAEAADIYTAFVNAWNGDSKSAFGSIVALNQTCTKQIAEFLAKVFLEIVIAPSYETEALNIFAKKPNIRILELKNIMSPADDLCYKYINGGVLTQTCDNKNILSQDLKTVTRKKPTETEINDMLFGWKVAKHTKSNAIVIAKNKITCSRNCITQSKS